MNNIKGLVQTGPFLIEKDIYIVRYYLRNIL